MIEIVLTLRPKSTEWQDSVYSTLIPVRSYFLLHSSNLWSFAEDISQGLALQFSIERFSNDHLIQILFSSSVILFMIFSTIFISSFYIDSLIICIISLFILTSIFFCHMISLPSVSYLKKTDLWYIFCHIIALSYIFILARLTSVNFNLEKLFGMRLENWKRSPKDLTVLSKLSSQLCYSWF